MKITISKLNKERFDVQDDDGIAYMVNATKDDIINRALSRQRVLIKHEIEREIEKLQKSS